MDPILLRKGIGYVGHKINLTGGVDNEGRKKLIADFLTNVPILIAPNAFKENMSAEAAAQCIERGIRSVVFNAKINIVPTADGGDGTRETLVTVTGGKTFTTEVLGPLRESHEAPFGILGDWKTAIVEMAETSGLKLAGGIAKNDPITATTYGVGQAILEASARNDISQIIICIGGSASTDGGVGALGALGIRFLDENDEPLDPKMGGAILEHIDKIDASGLSLRLKNVKLEVACDVENVPYGPHGAAYVFGPQKGADAKTMAYLDEGIKNLCTILARPFSEGGLNVDLSQMVGGGAAGALGMGLAAIGANLQPGFKLVADATSLAGHIKDAVIIFTAEGKLDKTSLDGKAPMGVLQLAKAGADPKYVVGIGGNLSDEARLYKAGFDYVASTVSEAMPWHEAKPRSAADMARASARTMYHLVNWLYQSNGLPPPTVS